MRLMREETHEGSRTLLRSVVVAGCFGLAGCQGLTIITMDEGGRCLRIVFFDSNSIFLSFFLIFTLTKESIKNSSIIHFERVLERVPLY